VGIAAAGSGTAAAGPDTAVAAPDTAVAADIAAPRTLRTKQIPAKWKLLLSFAFLAISSFLSTGREWMTEGYFCEKGY
jgi:hypothetical protein